MSSGESLKIGNSSVHVTSMEEGEVVIRVETEQAVHHVKNGIVRLVQQSQTALVVRAMRNGAPIENWG